MLFTLQRYEFFSKSQQSRDRESNSSRCCLPYKGTNFSANHNDSSCNFFIVGMLFTLQRYEFFSKSQQCRYSAIRQYRCCLPYKGTNFSANHNTGAVNVPYVCDVVYPTKVRIFQQITTELGNCFPYSSMLFTLQRYEFFSKSQHLGRPAHPPDGCCLPYKGTNFSANHNLLSLRLSITIDVVYPTKVRIFQQITTAQELRKAIPQMLFTLQRYEFFSKSQRI